MSLDATGPRRDSKSSAASFTTSTSKAAPSTESSSEVELNNHLTEIFAKIGSPIDSKKVMTKKKKNPDSQVLSTSKVEK
jgi:hypothetical protein